MKKEVWLENRPNRNVKSIEQATEEGHEVGDNGKFVDQLEDELEVDLFIQKLTPKQQIVVRMLYEGYNQAEIAQKLGTSHQNINNIVKSIKKELPF